jgi:perosamine synthetase
VSIVAFSRPLFGREEEEAAAAAIRSGWVVGGPRLAEFEERFAALSEVAHAVGVSSWTTGAFLVLKALGIGPGDEVIVPSLTFIASVNVIIHAGATPVFADVDPLTFNIDPDDVVRKIGPRTRAILPVDQLGIPCSIDRILEVARRHGLIVIQDAACAFGSRFRGRPVGAFAPITVFSLHARKIVTTGEGGMILTNDETLARRLRRLRHQGMSLSDFERHGALPTNFESYPEIGYNFRITDIQAAVGLCQLRRLPEMLAGRQRAAELYRAGLAAYPWLEPPFVPPEATANWQSFQIRVPAGGPLGRNELMESLYHRGVETRRGVMASHLEPPYASVRTSLPHTERAAAECLQLPMHSGLTDADVETVLAALTDSYDAATASHKQSRTADRGVLSGQ